jgi:hypothetical protein
LRQVERLALRDTFRDVEDGDVAKLLEANEVSERAADLAGSDQSNLGTRHVTFKPRVEKPRNSAVNGMGRQGRCTAS